MKKLIVILLLVVPTIAFAQFRDTGIKPPSVKDGITDNSATGNFLGIFNPENFRMTHTFSMSYTAFGGQGISLGTYTNSMYYKLMRNLNVQVDVSLLYSPYSTFGQSFQNDINGIYISRAAVNYRPSKDVFISLQYNSYPYSYYGGYSPYYNHGMGFYNGYYPTPFEEETKDELFITK